VAWKIQERREADGLVAERIVMKTEPEIFIPAFHISGLSRPAGTLIQLDDRGAASVCDSDLLVRACGLGLRVLAIDVRGLGEVAPPAPATMTLATLDGRLEMIAPAEGQTLEFEIATDSLMLGRSLLGQQVFDVLQAISYIKMRDAQGTVRPIAVYACGRISSLVALFAAVLDERVSVVALDGLLASFRRLIEEDAPTYPMTAYPFRALCTFDIPHAVALIAPRHVLLGRVNNGRSEPLSPAETTDNFRWTSEIYRHISGRAIESLPKRPEELLERIIEDIQEISRTQ